MLKLIVEFYRRYDARLASPDRQWQVNGNWFTTQSEMDMLVSPEKDWLESEIAKKDEALL